MQERPHVKKLRLGDRVRLLSGLPDEAVHRWYKTCRLVVNLSSQEAFGITVVEGLAAGKPVLVNNRMALTELAGKFAAVHAVDAGRLSPEQMAREMARLCDVGVVPADLSAYDWDSIAAQMAEVYSGLF
ncbi:MAG: glycosyltransferase [Chloroflexi bacterium]|nr:glycosyltransferase [Chloroflexota bacterium]